MISHYLCVQANSPDAVNDASKDVSVDSKSKSAVVSGDKKEQKVDLDYAALSQAVGLKVFVFVCVVCA